jgi:hypothetical protein
VSLTLLPPPQSALMVCIGTCLKPVGNISQKRRANLLDLGIYGRIILKRILGKWGVIVWTEFNRLRIKSVVGLFNTVSTFISHTSRCVSGSGKQLQAGEGICCMKIVSVIIIIFVLTSKYVWNERTHS